MPVQKVPQNWGDMLNLKPSGFGSNNIPPDPVPWDPGLPVRQYPPGDWGKWDTWQQMLLQLKDIPFPKLPDDIGKSLVLRPFFDDNSGYSVAWEKPAQLSDPRSFSIEGDGEAPAVQFDGTQNVTLQLTNLQAAKWKTARTLNFIGTDATGSVTFDGSGDVSITLNVLNSNNAQNAVNAQHANTADSATTAGHANTADNATNANHAETVTLSPDGGNLLQQRSNGLYYGTVSPAEFAIMYVDAVNGNDSNPGTEALPKRTIKATLDAGPIGIGREIRIYEAQEHIVDPAAPAILRDGSLYIRPYGPMTSALPQIPGRAPWDSDAARAFNTRITSLPFVNGMIGSAMYQFAPALYATSGTLGFSAITLNCGSPNGSGNPVAAPNGTFSTTNGVGAVSTSYCNINLPDALSRFVSSAPGDPQTVILYVAHIAGTGKLVDGPNNNNNVQVNGVDGIGTPAVIASYIGGVGKAPDVLYNITTNLNPSLFP